MCTASPLWESARTAVAVLPTPSQATQTAGSHGVSSPELELLACRFREIGILVSSIKASVKASMADLMAAGGALFGLPD